MTEAKFNLAMRIRQLNEACSIVFPLEQWETIVDSIAILLCGMVAGGVVFFTAVLVLL